ncbi:MAG: thioredoxin family protein [Pseudomonadota bacterium]
MRCAALILASLFVSTGCASAQQADVPAVCRDLPPGDHCGFDATRDAAEDIRAAQDKAAQNGLKSLIVFGANWCHDSRALAGHLLKPRFDDLLSEHYSVAYVDVGRKDRNIDLARAFGLDRIRGTPTVIVADSEGRVLNLDTAPAWRNAASRTEDEIYDYLERFAAME